MILGNETAVTKKNRPTQKIVLEMVRILVSDSSQSQSGLLRYSFQKEKPSNKAAKAMKYGWNGSNTCKKPRKLKDVPKMTKIAGPIQHEAMSREEMIAPIPV
jgi:hypothetical protein